MLLIGSDAAPCEAKSWHRHATDYGERIGESSRRPCTRLPNHWPKKRPDMCSSRQIYAVIVLPDSSNRIVELS